MAITTVKAGSGIVGQQFAAEPSPHTRQIRDVIYQASGIFMPDPRLRFLEERCLRRLEAVKLNSIAHYFNYLSTHPHRAEELKALLNEITVGETCFFRNQAQLDAVQNVLLPALVTRKMGQALHHIRIWSAGCSTGEEPYTLAMVLMENCGGILKDWTYEIIATDLNENSLEKAQQAVYGQYALRNVKEYYLTKYFEKRDDLFQVNREVRSHVRFSRVNLLDDMRMVFLKGMDVIFCCNVLIYFDTASKRRVVQHFFNSLLPNSYFFLGHSESLFGVTADFKLVHYPGATGYIRLQRETVRV